MNDLAQQEEQLLALVQRHDSLGPKQAAVALGWSKEQVVQAKGLISTGKGGGMQVAGGQKSELQVAGGQQASKPLGLQATEPMASEPKAKGPSPGRSAARPKGQQATGPQANKPKGQEVPKAEASKPNSLKATELIGQEAAKPHAQAITVFMPQLGFEFARYRVRHCAMISWRPCIM